jgi:hypothetical protein
MPIHDWTRVNTGVWHDFHLAWMVHLSRALNGGLLPSNYYAMTEQHADFAIADILSGQVGVKAPSAQEESSSNAFYRALRKTVTIRHERSQRAVSLVEMASPANKDRLSSVELFVGKANAAIRSGCHLLVVDLFRPGSHDPRGIHGAIWDSFDSGHYEAPADKPLIKASYVASSAVEAFIEPLAVGDVIPDGPLYLQSDRYVNVPLEATYQAAYRGVPAYWRGVLEGSQAPR